MSSIKVLYVEDEPFLAKVVKETLEHEGYQVQHALDGIAAMRMLDEFLPDICVLDVMLPKMDGFTLCRNIRERHTQLPILFLTAKAFTEDVVKGFEAGGNDYVRKPFSMEELMARVQNLIRMAALHQDTNTVAVSQEISFGPFHLIAEQLELHGPQGVHKISYREAQLLHLLAQNQNRTIDRREILLKIWGDDSFFNSRNLDVYVRKIRKYFSETNDLELITLKGKGYHFRV